MYGFPTQTVQDTVDALEYVRQLFAAGCIQSGFFHRFTCTVHSPVGKHPGRVRRDAVFAAADHISPTTISISRTSTGIDHDVFGAALKKALYNYMPGIGLELDVHEWFVEQHASVRGVGKRARRGAAGARCRARRCRRI